MRAIPDPPDHHNVLHWGLMFVVKGFRVVWTPPRLQDSLSADTRIRWGSMVRNSPTEGSGQGRAAVAAGN